MRRNRKTWKRGLALFLCAALTAAQLPTAAMAENGALVSGEYLDERENVPKDKVNFAAGEREDVLGGGVSRALCRLTAA